VEEVETVIGEEVGCLDQLVDSRLNLAVEELEGGEGGTCVIYNALWCDLDTPQLVHQTRMPARLGVEGGREAYHALLTGSERANLGQGIALSPSSPEGKEE
jgi:hypothetical protein